ncbi:hypothetical protein DFH06DRAFT_1348523 [Mycena polygramma]|nr:hypothetical protein DFH06DRAFT_1348523 [Mycena polygramma]
MSTHKPSKPKLVATNIRADQLIMDEGGVKDARYYCLPPFHGDHGYLKRPRGNGYPLHLVSQGHLVGTFTDWLEAKASLSGYPDSGNCGCNSIEECVEIWQRLCVLGIHPHPVDPAFLRPPSSSAAAFVNTTPRKMAAHGRTSPIKKEGTPVRTAQPKREGTPSASVDSSAQLLADLKRYCSLVRSPPPSPSKGGQRNPTDGAEEGDYVNFAIRGGGIVSSSAGRSQQRYLEMQRRGEEPDMLVTRSVVQASLFALEVEDGDEAGDENPSRLH